MGQWEPLADRIPLDVRRLATQLRRMKDRGGLTVPALAARTAQPVETWTGALAGRAVPPLDAVEVLAQISGADYDRIGALWRLAEKAQAGTGDRVPGRPLPHPDPLDPLGAEDGLPGRRRNVLLLAVVALLAAGALVGVLLTAGRSSGGPPEEDAAPTVSGPPSASGPTSPPLGGTAGGRAPGVTGAEAPEPDDTPKDRPSAAMGSASPSAAPGAGHTTAASAGHATPTGGATAATPAGGAGGGSDGGPDGGTGEGSTPDGGTTSAPATDPATATPSPTRTGLCLSLPILGICLG